MRGPRLGLSCPRDHFPSPRWRRTSYGEVPALLAPRFPLLALQIPGWGQGAGVSQRRPFRALRGRLLEMENVSPQPYLGWKQLSPPHTLCSPCLCPEEAGASTQACVLFFLFSLCSRAFSRDPWEMLLHWDQEGPVLVREGGKLHPFTPFPHQDHP